MSKKKEWKFVKNWAETQNFGTSSGSLRLPEGVQFFTTKKAGVYKIDVVPYVVKRGNPAADPGYIHPERTYFVHNNIGPDETTYCCLKSFNKKCPICEWIGQHRNDEGTKAVRDQIKQKVRQLWNVIDRTDHKKVIQVWDCSYHAFGKQLKEKVEAKPSKYQGFYLPEGGMSIDVKMAEDKFPGGGSFINAKNIEMEEREESLEDYVDKAVCLDDVLVELSYDRLAKIFHQEQDVDLPDEEEEEEEEEDLNDDEDSLRDTKKSRLIGADVKDTEESEEEPMRGEEKPRHIFAGRNSERIKVGDVVIYKGLECDVVRVSPDGSTLTLEDPDGDPYRAIRADEVKLVPTKSSPSQEVEEEEEKPKKKQR